MRLYSDLAEWWPVISPPHEYICEAPELLALLRSATEGPLATALELGSGGGNNASFLKKDLALTLLEPSDPMRALSVALNPECEHVSGDMRTARLGRVFDAVLVHDAIMYMTTEDDLRAAIETIAAHLRPGGGAVIAPDETAETFVPGERLECQEEDGRMARYIEWDLPAPEGETWHDTHYAFLLRDRDGTVKCVHDIHKNGLFPRGTWLRLLDQAGLEPALSKRTIEGVDYDVFVGRKR